MTHTLTLRAPDDFHVHLRDGAMLEAVLPYSAAHFARALIMPNLQPPITSLAAAKSYRERILKALPEGVTFTPFMSAYLSNNTDPATIKEGFLSGLWAAVKYYPLGATTHSEHGVTHYTQVAKVLETMQEIGMPLLIHGEATDPSVDIFDREAVFLEETLVKLLKDFPALKVVLEHITTKEAAEFVAAQDLQRVAATITPQHLFYNRNALFKGGISPHHYCLPILKRETHRQALAQKVTSGDPHFFAGTDSAPHTTANKEAACGCAGIFNAHAALSVYAQVFESANALPFLEAFLSENGARFYGIPLNEGKIVLYKEERSVPKSIALANHETIRPFLAGEALQNAITLQKRTQTIRPFLAGEALPWQVKRG